MGLVWGLRLGDLGEDVGMGLRVFGGEGAVVYIGEIYVSPSRRENQGKKVNSRVVGFMTSIVQFAVFFSFLALGGSSELAPTTYQPNKPSFGEIHQL